MAKRLNETAAEKLESENRKAKVSYLEKLFSFNLQGSGFNCFVQEYKFARVEVGEGAGIRERLKKAGLKDWRFDFADIPNKIAIEIEGGIFVGGRHVNGAGFRADAIKYNEAQILGWTLLRFTDREVKTGQAVRTVERLYKRRQKEGLLNVTPYFLT